MHTRVLALSAPSVRDGDPGSRGMTGQVWVFHLLRMTGPGPFEAAAALGPWRQAGTPCSGAPAARQAASSPPRAAVARVPRGHGTQVLPWSSCVARWPACPTACGGLLPGALPQRGAGWSLGEWLALWGAAAGLESGCSPGVGAMLLLTAGRPRADSELALWSARGWSPAGLVLWTVALLVLDGPVWGLRQQRPWPYPSCPLGRPLAVSTGFAALCLVPTWHPVCPRPFGCRRCPPAPALQVCSLPLPPAPPTQNVPGHVRRAPDRSSLGPRRPRRSSLAPHSA